jgi:hypothetical protein
MKYLIILFSFIILFHLQSCKPEPIDLIVPQNPQKMAVSSQLVNSSLLGVSISKTFEALQIKNSGIDSNGFNLDTSLLVGNAQVFLKSNDYKVQLVEIEKGIYGTETALINDFTNYQLEVVIDGKIALMAEAKKMVKSNFDSVFVYKLKNSNEVKVYYSLTDNPAEQNFYVVNYFIKNRKDNVTQQPTPELIAKRMLEQNISFDLITDADFKNGNYQIEKLVTNNYQSDTFAISVSNISKGYFDFLVAQKRAGTLFNQLRGEVINFPTNVKNGYGYFQLSEPDIRILDIDKR